MCRAMYSGKWKLTCVTLWKVFITSNNFYASATFSKLYFLTQVLGENNLFTSLKYQLLKFDFDFRLCIINVKVTV